MEQIFETLSKTMPGDMFNMLRSSRVRPHIGLVDIGLVDVKD